jgi:hypothetical protein
MGSLLLFSLEHMLFRAVTIRLLRSNENGNHI